MTTGMSSRAPCHLLIFGVTGDLARRKLFTALYHLEAAGLLHTDTRITGIARSDMDNEGFVDHVLENLKRFTSRPQPLFLDRLCQRLDYVSIDFNDSDHFSRLVPILDSGLPRIFYLATPAAIYPAICEGLDSAALIVDDSRIVLEKPIGHSLATSVSINDNVGRFFSEQQIYRIDHYLGKETVLNLLVLRFANALFTANWDHSCIDHVQITVAESVGIEDRWEFYDKAGQMRDMIQNHLLQILCLLAMEPPIDLEAESIRDEKLKVLRALRPITLDNLKHKVCRGQYTAGHIKGSAVPGYLEEAGANPHSSTETFVAIKVEIDNWRWSGVPFYIRSGKRLSTKQSEINIHFKPQPHNVFRDTYRTLPSNRLTIRLQPDEGIELQMLNKVPGITAISRIQTNVLDLSFSEAYHDTRIVDAYERLLLAVMEENQSLFVRRDEVEQAWQWVDAIIDAWETGGGTPDAYQAGSIGPTSSISLIARDDREWDE